MMTTFQTGFGVLPLYDFLELLIFSGVFHLLFALCFVLIFIYLFGCARP